MKSPDNQEKLLDAMTLLEIANRTYPSIDHFFSKYSTSDLVSGAHDLIQCVYSNGESLIEDETHELLATLAAARSYMDCGGHLWKPSVAPPEQVDHPQAPSSLLRRIRARFGV
ncbi:hypothetical protein FHT32_006824 [Variovorax sp. SG517]|uniref:hypothetical protein n=1 Tax=Variovorax sp. SG517 TaxID=2587117 RepID=UPI00159D4393|nr:hypothetical protein [Variovorax sp. SG517]NVM93130.1 hypothetical protein [Variovorax sp. SG517]